MDWINLFALAVNEENAAGGRVVTAPTNGAAGIIPATIRYYRDFCPGADQAGIRDFLLTAAAIGGLIKHNASDLRGGGRMSGAKSAPPPPWPPPGLPRRWAAAMPRSRTRPKSLLEHHLGMTCDPIGGLVQIPCIERNGMGAVKAVNAAALALRGDGNHVVPLDGVIKTMYETGRDMSAKYKETSQGGLAVNVVAC